MLALALPVAITTLVLIYQAMTNDNDDPPRVVEVPRRVEIPPFKTTGFRVGGDPTRYCALLASTPETQQQGMQKRRDLGGYDAMVFDFSADTTVSFVNHFVPVDLDIGWYDANGALVDFTTMEKCPDGANCPTYAARNKYRYAVETLAGGLGDLGLTGSGATLTVGGAC